MSKHFDGSRSSTRTGTPGWPSRNCNFVDVKGREKKIKAALKKLTEKEEKKEKEIPALVQEVRLGKSKNWVHKVMPSNLASRSDEGLPPFLACEVFDINHGEFSTSKLILDTGSRHHHHHHHHHHHFDSSCLSSNYSILIVRVMISLIATKFVVWFLHFFLHSDRRVVGLALPPAPAWG